mmetsp:Transcript_36069/g.88144  ORF Transcript_36069/g.88144 Transcript_36069/m.88144 type:complete len:201 (+) Transcript_36069:375-977(+)
MVIFLSARKSDRPAFRHMLVYFAKCREIVTAHAPPVPLFRSPASAHTYHNTSFRNPPSTQSPISPELKVGIRPFPIGPRTPSPPRTAAPRAPRTRRTHRIILILLRRVVYLLRIRLHLLLRRTVVPPHRHNIIKRHAHRLPQAAHHLGRPPPRAPALLLLHLAITLLHRAPRRKVQLPGHPTTPAATKPAVIRRVALRLC